MEHGVCGDPRDKTIDDLKRPVISNENNYSIDTDWARIMSATVEESDVDSGTEEEVDDESETEEEVVEEVDAGSVASSAEDEDEFVSAVAHGSSIIRMKVNYIESLFSCSNSLPAGNFRPG